MTARLPHRSPLRLALAVALSTAACAQAGSAKDAGPERDAAGSVDARPGSDGQPSTDDGGGGSPDATPVIVDAAPPPDSCDCIVGLCCDGCHILPDTTRCGGTPVAVNYRCNGSVCGSDAEYQEQYYYCDGTDGQCGTDHLVWEDWQLLQDCAGDALCASDGSTASCSTCTSGCSGDSCLCGQGTNVAPSGTPSISEGSTDQVNYGPQKMNDGLFEANCGFCWFYATTSPGTGWMRIDWSSAQELWGFSIDTVASSGSSCLYTSNRGLAGGTVQWWNGSSWVTDGTVSGKTNDWSYQFSAPITTTAIRIYGAYAMSVDNPVIFEWQVFACN